MIKKHRDLLYDILLCVLGAIILTSPPADPDFGWHFKYGEYFFKNHEILRENIFSYTNPNYKWLNTYWLFEVILYFTYTKLGPILPSIVLGIATSSILFYFLKKLNRGRTVTTLVFIFTAMVLGVFAITVRPHVYSSIFLLFLLHTLLFNNSLKKYLPFIFLIWTNLHADFFVGLFIYWVYTFYLLTSDHSILGGDSKIPTKYSLAKKLQDWLIQSLQSLRQKGLTDIKNIIITPTLCTLITLINPYGFGLWTTIFKELLLPVKSYVVEWSYFQLDSGAALRFFMFFFTLILVSSWAMRKKFGWWYTFLAFFFFFFSLKASYMARILVLFGSFSLLFALDDYFTQLFKFLERKGAAIIEKFVMGFTIALFLVILPKFGRNIYYTMNTNLWSKDQDYPYEAVQFIKANHPTGNMFNNYNWGGYLIWQLPEYKTFIDGRMTSWKIGNRYFMSDYTNIIRDPGKNYGLLESYINKYSIGWILYSTDSKFTRYLKEKRADEWVVAYSDDIGTVLYRK